MMRCCVLGLTQLAGSVCFGGLCWQVRGYWTVFQAVHSALWLQDKGCAMHGNDDGLAVHVVSTCLVCLLLFALPP